MLNDEEIDAFWLWFSGVAARLAADIEDETLGADLDARVARLGDIGWEVGPGTNAACALVVSPDGVRERLSLTERIVARAPQIPGWEIHSSKPPKVWDLRFEMQCDSGRTVDVDAREWRYVLWKFPDGTFDVVVEQRDLQGVTDADRLRAAAIVVEGTVGERIRLSILPRIEGLESLPADQAGKATPIRHLREHLARLGVGNGG